MHAEMVARVIQMILAPVVMVTACAITQGGFLAHYAAINDRLRAIAHERLGLLRDREADQLSTLFATERLTEIDYQIPDLLRRHKLTHDAVLAIYCAILCFVADMFAIALAAFIDSDWAATVVLIIFLISTIIMFWGILLAIIEIRSSHYAVHYEVRRVAGLQQDRPSS